MPSNLERAYDALRKADAAGNVEDAKKLAAYIRQQRSAAPAEGPDLPERQTGESFARGALQGVTFGFGDELAAGLQAGAETLASPFTDDDRSIGERYEQAREFNRARNVRAQTDAPGTFLTGEIAGGIASPVPLGKVKAATSLGKVGKAAGIGAAGGGLAGAGLSEAEDLSGIARDAATGAAGGAALGGAIGGLGAAGSRLSRGLLRPTEEGARAARAIEAEGGLLTPALQSESRTAKLLESAAESSFLGAGRMSQVRGKAIEAAQEPVEEFVQRLGSSATAEEAGIVAKEALEGSIEAFRDSARQAYGEVDKILQALPKGKRGDLGIGVSLLGVKQQARQMLNRGLRSSNATGKIKDILALPDEVSFSQAADIRSDLITPSGEVGQILVGKAKGQVKQLSNIVDRAMDDAFATSSVAMASVRPAKEAWRRANKLYRAGAKVFNDQMVSRLASTQPESIVSAIAKAKKPGTIRKFRSAIQSDEAWQEVQGAFLRNMLENSFENSGDIARGTFLSGKRISTKLTNFGDPALKELLGPAKLKTFREAVKVLERAQQRTGQGVSGLNIRGAIEGTSVLVSITTGNVAALALSLVPASLARLMTNPRAVRLLTQGFNAPPGSKQAVEALSRLSGLMAAEGLLDAGP